MKVLFFKNYFKLLCGFNSVTTLTRASITIKKITSVLKRFSVPRADNHFKQHTIFEVFVLEDAGFVMVFSFTVCT